MLAVVVVLLLAGLKMGSLYKRAYAPNIYPKNNEAAVVYIRTGWNYSQVMNALDGMVTIENRKSLEWVAQKKNYPAHIYPGRYVIDGRMSNNEFINMLRSGRQTPVKLTFNNIRTLEQLSERIAGQMEFSSKELLKALRDKSTQEKYGFTPYTINCMFIPNTYEVYWNMSVEGLLDRMHREYQSFWNKRRMHKADKLDMTPEEVITLASIVNEETKKNDEKARVAGVYINRLREPMRLQADPTVIYALGDFSIKRVLRKHYQISSPFNTYRVDGLPPGPICFPDIASIDAVLNYEKHSYLYFCASPDFSGYHVFARNLSEHNRNAAAYRNELNKRRIYR